jgi:hypothetical protein
MAKIRRLPIIPAPPARSWHALCHDRLPTERSGAARLRRARTLARTTRDLPLGESMKRTLPS